MNRKKWELLLCLLLAVFFMTACAANSEIVETVATGMPQAEETGAAEEADLSADLVIAVAGLTEEPIFVDWEQDGVDMQLIARRDVEGAVRLAFNTCQSCGGSPYAWFEYLGSNILQCQNCGLTFSLDAVGTARAAGCNPVTISEFIEDEDSVTVSEALLRANVERFVNWKQFAQ